MKYGKLKAMTGNHYESGAWYVTSSVTKYRVATVLRKSPRHRRIETIDSFYPLDNGGLTAAVHRCRELGRKNQANYKAL